MAMVLLYTIHIENPTFGMCLNSGWIDLIKAKSLLIAWLVKLKDVIFHIVHLLRFNSRNSLTVPDQNPQTISL